MRRWQHILVLVHDNKDGIPLLRHAATLATECAARLTVGHVASDYRAMNYVSDSLMNDAESEEVIHARALLSELAHSVSYPVSTLLLFSSDRLGKLEIFIRENQADLLICGHKNRFFGAFSSESMRFVDRLNIDFLIRHL